MSNYANEAGEPYMTAAALNFEAALDEQYAAERYLDDDEFFGDGPDCDTCEDDEDYAISEHGGCPDCGLGVPFAEQDRDLYMVEDSWLDGSYEE